MVGHHNGCDAGAGGGSNQQRYTWHRPRPGENGRGCAEGQARGDEETPGAPAQGEADAPTWGTALATPPGTGGDAAERDPPTRGWTRGRGAPGDQGPCQGRGPEDPTNSDKGNPNARERRPRGPKGARPRRDRPHCHTTQGRTETPVWVTAPAAPPPSVVHGALVSWAEARAKEVAYPFNRAEWPGTKAEFMAFLRWKNSYLAHRLQTHKDRLSEELRPHGVTFLPGNNKGKGLKFYRALYSDYRPA